MLKYQVQVRLNALNELKRDGAPGNSRSNIVYIRQLVALLRGCSASRVFYIGLKIGLARLSLKQVISMLKLFEVLRTAEARMEGWMQIWSLN